MYRSLCLIVLVIACIQAQRTPPDYRSLQIMPNQNQLVVLANYNNGTYQDQYQLYLYLRQNQQNIAEIDFQYQAQNESNQTQLQLQVLVASIIEYNSVGNPLSYQPNQTVVSRYPENNQIINWEPFVNETTVVDGIPVYVFQWTSKDGIFVVRVHIAPKPVNTSTGPLSPNDVKVDFEIHGYNFVGEQTRLALQTRVQSQTQSQFSGKQSTQNNNLLFENGSPDFPFGSFSWVPTAAGNGTINVEATTAQQNYGNQFDMYFSFLTDPNSIHSDIVWDPTIGLAYNLPPGGTPPSSQFCVGTVCGAGAIVLVVFIVIAVLVVVGTIVHFARKKKHGYDPIQQ